MKKDKEKRRIRKGAVHTFLAMILISGAMFAFDGVRRDLIKLSTDEITETDKNSDFLEKGEKPPAVNTVAFDPNSKPTSTTPIVVQNAGFSEVVFTPDRLSQGMLAIAGNSQPLALDNPDEMVNAAEMANEFYTVEGNNVMLHKDALDALNRLMEDYHEETELDDFVLYGTTDTYTGAGSTCPRYFAERSNGYTVDLTLLGVGSYLEFDGLDEEGWVVENCAKYGFIVRYPEGKSQITGENYCPWHLRYVGLANAMVMTEKNMCLEEYIDFLKDYRLDKPFTYKIGGFGYVMYTAEAAEGETPVKVPIGGNYDWSGDNRGTYIISYRN